MGLKTTYINHVFLMANFPSFKGGALAIKNTRVSLLINVFIDVSLHIKLAFQTC